MQVNRIFTTAWYKNCYCPESYKLYISTMNTYGNLCTEVYELSKPYPPTAAYEFYREYVKLVNGLIRANVCTGRFSLPYLEEGLNVHGFDSSAEMLSKLYAKAK